MYLISYDIEKDSLRTKIAHHLIANGLYRIQYSVYLGTLSEQDYAALEVWLNNAMQQANTQKDSIMILKLEKPQVKTMKILGISKHDIDEIVGDKRSLVI